MGFKSLSKSNKNYEVCDIILPTRYVFSTIETIDRNLKFLYASGTAENDFEPIFHSVVREDPDNFNEILDRVDERIDRIENIDDGSINQFLYKEKRGGAFLEKFSGINDCLIEGVYMDVKTPNHFEKRILDIVRRLSYIRIDPFYYT